MTDTPPPREAEIDGIVQCSPPPIIERLRTDYEGDRPFDRAIRLEAADEIDRLNALWRQYRDQWDAERVACVSLRSQLAEANRELASVGVRGSPPPWGSLIQRLELRARTSESALSSAVAERDEAVASNQRLREWNDRSAVTNHGLREQLDAARADAEAMAVEIMAWRSCSDDYDRIKPTTESGITPPRWDFMYRDAQEARAATDASGALARAALSTGEGGERS